MGATIIVSQYSVKPIDTEKTYVVEVHSKKTPIPQPTTPFKDRTTFLIVPTRREELDFSRYGYPVNDNYKKFSRKKKR